MKIASLLYNLLRRNGIVIASAIVLIISIVTWLSFPYWVVFLPQTPPVALPPPNGYDIYEKLGQYGDSFGVINSLFSSITFAMLIAGYLFQGNQFRKQLDSNQEQLDLQREIHKETIAITKQQGFETTFFNLLNILLENYKKLDSQESEESIFRKILIAKHGDYSRNINCNASSALNPIAMYIGNVPELKSNFYATHRLFDELVKYTREHDDIDHKRYINIISSSISYEAMTVMTHELKIMGKNEDFNLVLSHCQFQGRHKDVIDKVSEYELSAEDQGSELN
ncbi:hypothetical protein [Chromobacterium violaceum]|uniref:hypothetical protein n=1 Tax=Chromobacterium violaceum TaxID=536 RepID=UPI0019524EC9|nr:hypothetical protein [Chromobacterium violaceum]QRO33977.1 hypothetical protein I6K04_04330 [Chromobacterium violaceum]QRQ16220.1 hypothetical protein I6K03_18400 [Chromobacterium violaceum]